MGEFSLEYSISIIREILNKDRNINKQRFKAYLGDLLPGHKKFINGIMTIFEADFFMN